ncbi:chromate transporter [Candidatus Daviesbacteria bacterium]|nr:chromate transporter [Candidatus Daviesbacteria bacterium]
MEALETQLDLYLGKKAPSLPTAWKEFIVNVMPWATLIIFIITLPLVLTFFGISAFLLPISFLGGVGNGFGYTLSVIVVGASLVLDALAIPGLFKRAARSWRLLYWSALLNAVYNLVTLNLGGLIIGTLISLYILFQIKSYYK